MIRWNSEEMIQSFQDLGMLFWWKDMALIYLIWICVNIWTSFGLSYLISVIKSPKAGTLMINYAIFQVNSFSLLDISWTHNIYCIWHIANKAFNMHIVFVTKLNLYWMEWNGIGDMGKYDLFMPVRCPHSPCNFSQYWKFVSSSIMHLRRYKNWFVYLNVSRAYSSTLIAVNTSLET